MKRMIFHIPLKIDNDRHSASHIRPMKMLHAFKSIGYDVDVIMGNCRERKQAIQKIKKNIKNGEKYDFMYSESSTMPTLLTENHHYPTHPFLDFSFFKFCKKNGIKIGVFYRDIYWKFPEFINNWKSRVSIIFYKYDLKKYDELIDVLFIPSNNIIKYLPPKYRYSLYELPSGAEVNVEENNNHSSVIELFYVGGIGQHYDLTMLFKCVSQCPNIHFTVCCRKEDWNEIKEHYSSLLSNNITIIHKSGKELDEYYRNTDLCVLYVKPSIYWEFAMPYKLFEFIGRGKPILASSPTNTAEFVEENNCGITLPYDEEILLKTLKNLDKDQIKILQDRVKSFVPSQSWEERAKEVVQILGN